jgi:hypothetical protein
MKWIPHRDNGDQTPVDAQKFKHWIGTQAHWFCVHESLSFIGQFTVSDYFSGFKVADVPYTTLIACRGDSKAAARLTLNRLVERAGESRVLEVLNKAPTRAKILPKTVASATL